MGSSTAYLASNGTDHAQATQPTAAGDPAKKKQAALAAGSLVISRLLSDAQATAVIEKQTKTKIHTEYDRELNIENDAGKRFRAALPGVVSFINASLARAGIPVEVTSVELATNFLAEGGDRVLSKNRVDHIDGYQDVGIDSFINKFESLKAFLPADLIAFASKKQNHEVNTNERGGRNTTITNMNVEQALQANASMYAQAIAQLTADLKALEPPVDIATLPEAGRMFWATVYFNAGFRDGKDDLEKKGVDWWKTAWKKGDKNTQQHALERMGSEELLAHDEAPLKSPDGSTSS